LADSYFTLTAGISSFLSSLTGAGFCFASFWFQDISNWRIPQEKERIANIDDGKQGGRSVGG